MKKQRSERASMMKECPGGGGTKAERRAQQRSWEAGVRGRTAMQLQHDFDAESRCGLVRESCERQEEQRE
eukprot:2874312-Rhodomonas_salina.1